MMNGEALVSAVLSGQFGESAVERELAAWFDEQPQREVQRQRFVDFATAFGCSGAMTAEYVLSSVMKSQKDPTTGFGNALAQVIDRLIIFEPPSTDDQIERQRVVMGEFEVFKARLRVLDRDLTQYEGPQR